MNGRKEEERRQIERTNKIAAKIPPQEKKETDRRPRTREERRITSNELRITY